MPCLQYVGFQRQDRRNRMLCSSASIDASSNLHMPQADAVSKVRNNTEACLRLSHDRRSSGGCLRQVAGSFGKCDVKCKGFRVLGSWKLLHTFDGVRLAGLLPASIASVATLSPQPAAQSSDVRQASFTNLCRIV